MAPLAPLATPMLVYTSKTWNQEVELYVVLKWTKSL